MAARDDALRNAQAELARLSTTFHDAHETTVQLESELAAVKVRELDNPFRDAGSVSAYSGVSLMRCSKHSVFCLLELSHVVHSGRPFTDADRGSD